MIFESFFFEFRIEIVSRKRPSTTQNDSIELLNTSKSPKKSNGESSPPTKRNKLSADNKTSRGRAVRGKAAVEALLAASDDEDEADAKEKEESEQEEEKQMSLEEYEAVMAEKKAALNATKESAFKVDDSQFAGMKTFAKQEEVVDLSLDKHAKVIGANKGPKDKDRKEISQILDVGFRVQSEEEKRPDLGGILAECRAFCRWLPRSPMVWRCGKPLSGCIRV